MVKVADNALGTLQEILRKQMNEITDDIATGACQDFAEYKFKTGMVWGLATAERELLDLNKLIEEE